jgi:hypothetical protein
MVINKNRRLSQEVTKGDEILTVVLLIVLWLLVIVVKIVFSA